MRFSNVHRAVLAELTRQTGSGSKHPHRNCRVHFGAQGRTEPQTQRAAQRRSQLATQCAGQAGTHCEIRRAIDCRIERGVEVPTDCGVECHGPGAIGCRVQPRVRRGTERRAKLLIDDHIDGRIVLGLEPRGQPGSDSPPASARLRQNSGPSSRAPPQTHGQTFARSDQCHTFRVTVTLTHSARPTSACQMAVIET